MKKLMMLILVLFIGHSSMAQDKLYLVFEFMQVDNEQEGDYWETEAFWEKLHEQRVANGSIIGWDLWALGPGGEQQGFQYVTVTLHKTAASMFNGIADFDPLIKATYPNMSEEALDKAFDKTSASRDLAVRVFMEQVASTEDSFDMPVGTVATMDMMKVDMGNYAAYEKAESTVFKKLHQAAVDKGEKGNWGLLRFISPIGSDTYASHMTVSMYTDFAQMLNQNINFTEGATPEESKMMLDGIAARDMKYVYTARLLKKVR